MKVRRIYIDSSVFIELIDGKTQTHVDAINACFQDIEEGKAHLFTSTLTIAEVTRAHWELTRRAIDPKVEANLDAMWANRAMLTMVEVTEFISREAAKLSRAGIPDGWSLGGADLLHLCSAKYARVDVIYAYDDKWDKWKKHMGIPTVEPPAKPKQLSLGGEQ